MSRADVDDEGLRRLRDALARYATDQHSAIDGVTAEVERCEDLVARRLEETRRRYEACWSDLAHCEASGTSEQPVDCSGYRRAYEAAREDYIAAQGAQSRVSLAASQWEREALAHSHVLGNEVPRMRAGLERRIESLEAYNHWTVSVQHEAGLSRGGRTVAPPIEAREGAPNTKEIW